MRGKRFGQFARVIFAIFDFTFDESQSHAGRKILTVSPWMRASGYGRPGLSLTGLRLTGLRLAGFRLSGLWMAGFRKSVSLCFSVCIAMVALWAGSVVAATASEDQPITLSYWHFYSGEIGRLHLELVDEFNRTHPHIVVEEVYSGTAWTMRDKLAAALTVGAGPDVAGIDQFWISQLAAGGHVTPVESFFDKTTDFHPQDLYPAYWETARYDDILWSMPFAVSNVVLYYNIDLMQKLGLNEDAVPTRWQDFLALKTLTEGSLPNKVWVLDMPTTASTGLAYYFLITLWQHGGDLYDSMGQAAFHSPEAVRTLNLWQELIDSGVLDLRRPNLVWEAGEALFHVASSARIRSNYRDLPFEYGVAPLPRADYRVTGIGGRSLSILTRDEKKQQAAWTFIQWMSAPERNLRWSQVTGYSPIWQRGYASDAFQTFLEEEPRVAVALHEMLYARPRANRPSYGDVSRILGEAVEAVFYLGTPAEEALERAAREANDVIERYERLYGR